MTDWKRLFENFNVPQRNPKGWSNVNCPFCRNPVDKHFNGGFSNKGSAYNCWRCGKHYWLEALSLILKMSPFEAKKVAFSYSTFVANKDKPITNVKNIMLPGSETLTQYEQKYLMDRHYNVPYLQKKYGIRGGGIAGDWSYRIIIPIFYEGKLVSWTGRSILDRKTIDELKIPRYKNLEIEQSVINPKHILFNIDNARNDYVILVEGPFDVLRMGDDTVCSLGTSITPEQKLLLSKRYKKVFIAFDNEVSAQMKAKTLGMDLNTVGLDVEIVNICKDYNKNDPGELTTKEVNNIKKELL